MYNDFYVYTLCYPETEIPFYIGKGRKSRIIVSARLPKSPKKTNFIKYGILKRIYDSDNKPNKIKLYENLDEAEALEIETELIKKYGRKCDGSGTLANIAIDSTFGNTGWLPSAETRETWKLQRTGVTQTKEHINSRISSTTGKRRSPRQKYNCLVSALHREDKNYLELYINIINLFNDGNFIDTIYKRTLADKAIISKIIKNIRYYESAINKLPFDESSLISNLKWSCQRISHILKDRNFYLMAIVYLDKNLPMNELIQLTKSNSTRMRFIIKNRKEIMEILDTYE